MENDPGNPWIMGSHGGNHALEWALTILPRQKNGDFQLVMAKIPKLAGCRRETGWGQQLELVARFDTNRCCVCKPTAPNTFLDCIWNYFLGSQHLRIEGNWSTRVIYFHLTWSVWYFCISLFLLMHCIWEWGSTPTSNKHGCPAWIFCFALDR